MGSRAGDRPWLWQWPSLRMMKLGYGVRLGLLQASWRDDHGVLCRYRRVIGKRQLMRCGRNRANRARGQGGQRARDLDRMVPRSGDCGDADRVGGRTAVAMAVRPNIATATAVRPPTRSVSLRT